jgi:hypothetical protein
MMPLITWADGAWIGRIANVEDIDRWLIPLARRPAVPSWWTQTEFDGPIPLQREPVFIYIDREGYPQVSFMLSGRNWGNITRPPEPLQVQDLGGPGLGRVTDLKAKKRITGFIYEDLLPEAIHPFNRDTGAILGIPWVVADKTFSRSLTSNRRTQWKQAKDSFLAEKITVDELRVAAYAAIRLRITKKNFFIGPMSIHSLPMDMTKSIAMGQQLPEYHRNERIAVLLRFTESTPRKLWWEVHWIVRPGSSLPYYDKGTLGTHEQGPLEALHAAGIFMPESELDDWLDEHADFDGELTFSPELYSALSLENPMLWDLEKFKDFDKVLQAQQEG